MLNDTLLLCLTTVVGVCFSMFTCSRLWKDGGKTERTYCIIVCSFVFVCLVFGWILGLKCGIFAQN